MMPPRKTAMAMAVFILLVNHYGKVMIVGLLLGAALGYFWRSL